MKWFLPLIASGVLFLAFWFVLRHSHPLKSLAERIVPTQVELRARSGAPDYIPDAERMEFSPSGVFENSIEALERAYARGFRSFRLELRRSSDAQFVITHDPILDRVSELSGTVSEKTLSELKAIDLGDGSRMLALDEVLEHFIESGEYEPITFELVLLEGRNPTEAILMLLEMIHRYKLQASAIISSPWPWVLGHVESLEPKLATELAFLGLKETSTIRTSEYGFWTRLFGIDGVQVPASIITDSWLNQARSRGLHVTALNVEDLDTYDRLIKLKVDSILTFQTTLHEAIALPDPPTGLSTGSELIPGDSIPSVP